MSFQKAEFNSIGETLYSARLSNGLELRLIPKKGFSTAYAVFAANYGGAHRRFTLDGEEHDTPAGVAHFLEHKMFDMPNGDNALNILSANGADPNAFTSAGITCYYFECTKNFEENLRMLLRFVSTPYFTEETVQKEQGIIAQEIRMGEDDPGLALYYNLLRALYAEHPIRDRVAGTVESIGQISHETLYACHKAFYRPSNMTLCVEGDIDISRILEIAEEELPGEESAVPTASFGPEESMLPAERYHKEELEVSAPQFLIGAKFKQAPAGSNALRQRLVSQLALRMLVGHSSPFYTRLYAQGLLNYDFSYEADFSTGTAHVIIGGEGREPDKVLALLKEEVAAVKANGFDRELFRRSKRASLGARLRGLEDFENVCLSVATGVFDGYCAFDAPAVLEDISCKECEDFVTETLADERLAISIIAAKKE